MDQDITRWLKNELGLVQMSESDLNSLMFHPRHGTLCRRLIKFLAESTLCKERYPNVYAKEEAKNATEDLEAAREKLSELNLDLEDISWASENSDNELNFLKVKSEFLEEMREQQTMSLAAFEEIARRPNLGIERMSRDCFDLDYLTDTSLQNVYTVVDLNNMEPVSAVQLAAVDTELKNLRGEIDSVHSRLTELFQSIGDKRAKMEMCPPKAPIKAKFDDLMALRLPEFEEETIEINEDEKKLKDINVSLSKQVYELDQKVAELSRLYKERKGESEKLGIDSLSECLTKLDEMKTVVKSPNL